MKYSFKASEYAKYRPDLLGSNFLQQSLKDYNGQVYWLSFNINAFKKTSLPDWLNVAIGYGADGMYNGNPDEEGTHREFYASLDINLRNIKTDKRFLDKTLKILSFIKVPMPAFKLSQNKLNFYPCIMDNKIRIGDKIKFLDSEGGGEVISILGNSYIVLTNEGFEEKHSINAIIKVNEDLEKSLKTTYVPDGFKKLTKKVQKDSIFKSKTPLVWEIDIHIENLLDNFYHMSNHEIVNYQLDKCENIIHKALKAKVHKLVIIHGKGQGILRKEVHNLLYSFKA